MTDWIYHTHGVDGDPAITVAGVPIWAHEWHRVPGAEARVRDPLYAQPYTFPVYEIAAGSTPLRFAAGEFSASVFGFFLEAFPAASPSLRFHFRLEPAEYARALTALSQWSRWRFVGLALAVVPFIPILAAVITGDDRWMRPGTALSFLALPALAYLLWGPWAQRFRVRRAQRGAPLLREEFTYEFSGAGLATQAGPSSGQLGWPGMLRVRENPEFYFFYFSDRCAYYLPKRLLADPATDHALRTLIRERAPDTGVHLAQDLPAAADLPRH